MKAKSIIFLFLLVGHLSWSADSLNVKKRVIIASSVEVVGYGAMLYGLNQLWYADYPKSKFHFFNDNKEWLQMDKIGHAGSCYYFGRVGYEAIKWTGVKDRSAILWGGTTGFLYLTVIEALDGFSAEWGASPGDLIANTSGTLLFLSQQWFWNDQKIKPKFSFSPSPYAKYRPNLLGGSFIEQMLKDYNGQTYWLSFRPEDLFQKKVKWPIINLAIGYGADGMIGGNHNPEVYNGQVMPYFERTRSLYLGLDINWDKIPTNRKWLKRTFMVLDMVKVPSPTLYLNQSNLHWKWIYF